MPQLPYKFCNDHLLDLYRAINSGDIEKTTEIEHELSPEEECVACAYLLKAKGNVRFTLAHFLNSEGFRVTVPVAITVSHEFKFWVTRLIILGGLFYIYFNGAVLTKTFMVLSKTVVTLGMFGYMGVFLLTVASFLLIEQWVLE